MKASGCGACAFFHKNNAQDKTQHDQMVVSKNDVKRNQMSNNGPQRELVSDIIGWYESL
jgi:hypothetical protein